MTNEDTPDLNANPWMPYFRITFTTTSRGRLSRRRLVGVSERTVEGAIKHVKGRHPNASFESAKRFRDRFSNEILESYSLDMSGEVKSSHKQGDQDPHRLEPETMITPPTPDPTGASPFNLSPAGMPEEVAAWGEDFYYWRMILNTGGIEGKRILFEGYYRSLEEVVMTAKHAHPEAIFFVATRANHKDDKLATHRFDLKVSGEVDQEFKSGVHKESPAFNFVRDLDMVKDPMTAPEPKPAEPELYSKRLYITSLDEEAERRPGEDDHVRLQRATLTMLRALYRQNEEITAAVTRPPILLDGVEAEPDEPEDFDAHRCGAFSERTGFGRCVLLDYHEGFPSKGHNFDRRTACVCGKQIWSRACRQSTHLRGPVPAEYMEPCEYESAETGSKCIRYKHPEGEAYSHVTAKQFRAQPPNNCLFEDAAGRSCVRRLNHNDGLAAPSHLF